MRGTYSGGHARMPGILDPSAGCAPTICTGVARLQEPRDPVIVPVVPIADTKCVIRPSVWLPKPRPVPTSWARGLSGLPNWSRTAAPFALHARHDVAGLFHSRCRGEHEPPVRLHQYIWIWSRSGVLEHR